MGIRSEFVWVSLLFPLLDFKSPVDWNEGLRLESKSRSSSSRKSDQRVHLKKWRGEKLFLLNTPTPNPGHVARRQVSIQTVINNYISHLLWSRTDWFEKTADLTSGQEGQSLHVEIRACGLSKLLCKAQRNNGPCEERSLSENQPASFLANLKHQLPEDSRGAGGRAGGIRCQVGSAAYESTYGQMVYICFPCPQHTSAQKTNVLYNAPIYCIYMTFLR